MSASDPRPPSKWDAPNQVIHAPRERICARPECGKTYEAHSNHGKYCSPYCRIRHHRDRQRDQAEATS